MHSDIIYLVCSSCTDHLVEKDQRRNYIQTTQMYSVCHSYSSQVDRGMWSMDLH